MLRAYCMSSADSFLKCVPVRMTSPTGQMFVFQHMILLLLSKLPVQPFQGLKADTYEDSGTNWLSLIDGSSNQENVPLGPMFVRARGLDLVVAVDASADTSNNFPKYVSALILICTRSYHLPHSGSSIVFSQQRISTILNTSHQSFPPIPSSTSQFISTGVNERATFFGCDPTNSSEYPLVVYFPNSPPVNGDDPVTK